METKITQALNSTKLTPIDVKSFTCPYQVGAETLTIFGLAYLWPNGHISADVEEVVKGSQKIWMLLNHLQAHHRFSNYANAYASNLFPIKNTGVDKPEREEKSVIFDPAINLESSFNDFKTAI
jgi:hypothetical protein